MPARADLFHVSGVVQRSEWVGSCWKGRFYGELEFKFGFVCNFHRRCVLCRVSRTWFLLSSCFLCVLYGGCWIVWSIGFVLARVSIPVGYQKMKPKAFFFCFRSVLNRREKEVTGILFSSSKDPILSSSICIRTPNSCDLPSPSRVSRSINNKLGPRLLLFVGSLTYSVYISSYL